MKEKNLKIGMWCAGTSSDYANVGKIEAIKKNKGAWKALIYKIGNHWYFADEIKRYWEGELEELIGKGNEYVFKHPALISFNKEKKFINSIKLGETFLAKGDGFSINLYMLRPSTLRGLCNTIANEISEGSVVKEGSQWSNWYWNRGGRNKMIKKT